MVDLQMYNRGSKNLYEHIYQQIRDQIVAGSIGAGEHLPSKRALAEHLGISVITVEKAYNQLVAEGYVYSLPRRGFYASALSRPAAFAPPLDADRDASPRPRTPPATSTAHGAHAGGGGGAPAPSVATARPALSEAAQEGARLWQRALRATMTQESEAEVFSPAPAQGTYRLQRAISDHLRESRGMDADPANIVIGAGAQLLDTMLVQLLGADATYAVEDPGYLRLTHIYRAMGCTVRHIPLDDEGVCTDALARADADILHLMPSHQFPSGRVTSIARRYALLSWAAQKPGRYLIEDDFDCEFRLAGKPIPPLAAIDASGCVIYTNTFSKSLSSALRLAYMVLPDDLMERFNTELGFYSSTVSSIDQIALARLLETGEYGRHVRRVRKRARAVRDALVGELERIDASADAGSLVVVEGADAGLHAVLAVATSRSPHDLLDALASYSDNVSLFSDCAWRSQHAASADGRVRLVVQYLGLSVEAARSLAHAVLDACWIE